MAAKCLFILFIADILNYDGSVLNLHLWDVFIQEQQGGIRVQNNQIKTKIDQGAK